MKIIKLRFKNINSLAGNWEIDFTHPEFANNGLFAITGKTGSGKSSILDAISLALYGKTPRVDITGNSNDVMTRGTSDCYAEIFFEVTGKTWTATWKQERSRNGNLKPVERIIADENNVIVADKISIKGRKTADERTVNEKIQEILGLTFEQFTKVILLAQGSFAAFLQADKSDKGELLEQITETGIYGTISRKVFERSKAEKEKLDQITFQLGEIKILSEDEILRLQAEIEDFGKQKDQINNDLQTIENERNRLVEIKNLGEEIAASKEKLPHLEENTESAKINLEKSEDALKHAGKEKEKTDEILVKVRELDIKTAEKNNALKSVMEAIAGIETEKTALSRKFAQQNHDLKNTQDVLSIKQAWAKCNAKYESLIGNYAAVENRNVQVNQLLNDFNIKAFTLTEAQKDMATKTVILRRTMTDFDEKENALSDKSQELKSQNEALVKTLNGQELSGLQTEKENITFLGTKLKDLIATHKEILTNRREIKKYAEQISLSETSEKTLAEKIVIDKKTAENLELQINLLDENIKLTKIIQSLDDHRKALEDGKACPLCGSKEHPFARGNEPKTGEKETELSARRNQFREFVKTVREDEKTVERLKFEINNYSANKEKEEKHLSENRRKRSEILSAVKNPNVEITIPDDENSIEHLEKMHLEKQEEYGKISFVIAQAEEKEKQVRKLRDEIIPRLRTAKETAEKAKTEAGIALKLAEKAVENCTCLSNEAKEKYETGNQNLLSLFAEYQVANIEDLKNCLTQWNKNKKTIEDFTVQELKLANDINLTVSEIANNIRQHEKRTLEKEILEKDTAFFLLQRKELFGDRKVEDEEIRLKKLLSAAEKAKTAAEKAKNEANTNLAQTNAIISDKEKKLEEKSAEKHTDRSMDELQAEQTEKKAKSDELSQKTGANKHLLEINSENLAENRKKLEEKELRQQASDKWKQLDALIGSSDGKKYRNFAQALTYENLIMLSNVQLRKMSERYILKRVGDLTNPFDLSVIDKFQNCEERTAQNLSGGEKFIVSLSLALGLANMAGRNMKIDTMFIDEGFGTLDSDYLDTALTALSNLHGEGKLIGVISHLSELKDRIPTHIEVTPKGDGHSEIKMKI